MHAKCLHYTLLNVTAYQHWLWGLAPER